jgi:hypothetical protein
MSGVDVGGRIRDRWNLASHEAAYVTANQNATVKALLHGMANGPGPFANHIYPEYRPRKAVQDGCRLAAPSFEIFSSQNEQNMLS